MNISNGPVYPVDGPSMNSSVLTACRRFTALAEELDGWQFGIAQCDAYPPIFGLHNVEEWEPFEEPSLPMHVGVLLTTESTYIVLPLIAHPVVVETASKSAENGPFDNNDVQLHWEFGSDNPSLLREAIDAPLTSIEDVIAKVRQHCENVE